MALITPLNIRDRLIELLTADASTPTLALPLLGYDPQSISEAESQHACVVILGNDNSQGSLGPRGAGTKDMETHIAIVVRAWQNSRTKEAQDKCILLTNQLIEAVWHYETAMTADATAQLWYQLRFLRDPISTTNHPSDKDYVTITRFKYSTRILKS